MQVVRKKDFTPVAKEVVSKVLAGTDSGDQIVWDKSTTDIKMRLPYGKYRGMTLEWIIANDDWYYNWMLTNDIIKAWGLVKKVEEAKPKSIPVTDNNSTGVELWVGIRFIDEPCTASIWL